MAFKFIAAFVVFASGWLHYKTASYKNKPVAGPYFVGRHK